MSTFLNQKLRSDQKAFFAQVIDEEMNRGLSNAVRVNEETKARLIDEYCKQGTSDETDVTIPNISE